MGSPETQLHHQSNSTEKKGTQNLQIIEEILSDCGSDENKDSHIALDLQSKDLAVFPHLDLASNGIHITHINLNYNNISRLPANISQQLPMLQTFAANGNELSFLPDGFGDFSYLQQLSLCENNLVSLPESLSKLSKLHILKLNANRLKSLHAEIGQNVSLEVLCVDENKLKRLPATLGLLKNLNVLEANCNMLETLPSTLNYLESLQVVDLSNNRLTHIPESFGDLKNLTHIDFSENRLGHLCQNFQSTRTLQRLYLDQNVFARCPDWFEDLENIIEIRMKCNYLSGSAIPEGFGLMSRQLKILDMRGNSIPELPNSFGHLISLEVLLLGTPLNYLERSPHFQNGNWISLLPSNFNELLSLKQLHLEENHLRALPDDIGELVHLENLYLGSNMLLELPASFTKLVALRKCQLSKNRLMKLPEDIGALEMLTDLHLDSNKLKTLPASMKNLTNLEFLDLSDNKLKQWQSELVSAMTRLKSLSLFDNKFVVPDCDIPNVVKRKHFVEYGEGFSRNTWRGRGNREDFLRQPVEQITNAELSDSRKFGDRCNSRSSDSRSIQSEDIDVEEDWGEDTDRFSLSSSSASFDRPACQPELVESWDLDTEHQENDVSNCGTGQFDLDDEEPVKKLFDPAEARLGLYNNCLDASYLDIHRHLSAPYVHHAPAINSYLYVPDSEVPGQFDSDSSDIVDDGCDVNVVGSGNVNSNVIVSGL